jgi:hypothetical protein
MFPSRPEEAIMHKNSKKQAVEINDLYADVEYDILVGPTVTVASVHWCGFTATGEARRQPNDEADPSVGKTLALGRALECLGEDLVRFGIQRSAH